MSSAVIIKELLCKLQTLVGLINDLRSNLIRLLREHRNYGLVWENKPNRSLVQCSLAHVNR